MTHVARARLSAAAAGSYECETTGVRPGSPSSV